MSRKKILFIVEGEATEPKFIGQIGHRLLNLTKSDYEIFPFCTAIYELYEIIKSDEYTDLLDYLVFEKGLLLEEGVMPKEAFSSIYLFFDYEPCHQKYTDENILEFLNIFNNETENGKLYINYPMFESFFHLTSLPDYKYITREVEKKNCIDKIYYR